MTYKNNTICRNPGITIALNAKICNEYAHELIFWLLFIAIFKDKIELQCYLLKYRLFKS